MNEQNMLLEVSDAAYTEIRGEIEKAGLQDRFRDNPLDPERPQIVMDGLTLSPPIEMRPNEGGQK